MFWRSNVVPLFISNTGLYMMAKLCRISPCPLMMPLTESGRNYFADTCRSQQPGVALETTKEHRVALATDEMRGYPDNNATGIHLAKPRCPFSDRYVQAAIWKGWCCGARHNPTTLYLVFFFILWSHSSLNRFISWWTKWLSCRLASLHIINNLFFFFLCVCLCVCVWKNKQPR